jgi:hypothetical protein
MHWAKCFIYLKHGLESIYVIGLGIKPMELIGKGNA